ncbi:MAG: hypothetical protein EBT86_11680 [Actinobacteria bacterium]|nr:hypothetical protein [Actinomycetota bacterium]
MSQTAKLAKHLEKQINWQRFVNLAASLGDQLNDAQWRFFKAIVFENAMEAYSDGSVKYIGEEGCDLLLQIGKKTHRVEMKYSEHALYTPKGRSPRQLCQSIILMNSKGTNKHQVIPDNYADYLLIVGLRASALLDRATLSRYAEFNGDSITAVIPTSEMEFVFTPDTVNVTSLQQINLREELNEAVRRTIAQVQ